MNFVKSTVLLLTLFVSFLSLAADYKVLKMDDLEKMINSKSHFYLYDVNVDSTREKIGLIPGAQMIDSSGEYDASILPQDKKSKLVFYCANKMCTSSDEAAEKAIKLGYQDVSVMKDGIFGWKKAGKKLEQTNRTPQSEKAANKVYKAEEVEPKEANSLVKNKKAVIYDVRENEERFEIVDKTQWFPMSKLSDNKSFSEFKSKLSKDKTYIFYCASGRRAKKIAEMLSSEGYSTLFFRNADEWKSAGLPTEKGPAK